MGVYCSATLSLTSALDEGGWLTPRPGQFIPRKETRYALYRGPGGPQSRSGRMRKISPPPGFLVYSPLLCLYFIRTSFFVSIVLHFTSCLYLQHKTQTSMPPTGFFFILVLSLHFIRICSFVLIVLALPLVLYSTTQTSMPPTGFETATPASERPQTYTLDRVATGICKITFISFHYRTLFLFRSPDRPARCKSLYQLRHPGPLLTPYAVCMSCAH